MGYIGLPTAAILASKGANVIGVDVKLSTVEAVNRGQVPFVEPDLEDYVIKAVAAGQLSATMVMPVADTYIVAVPTPFNADHTVDLRFIESAATDIAAQLSGDELVILESTSPPGTTEHLAQFIMNLRPDLSLDGAGGQPIIHVAHCPERVLPGRVMIELVSNDRIVGGLTTEAAQRAQTLYGLFCDGEILLTDAATAEMAKLVENSYRDVNIAFANELSMISAELGIDVWELINLANHHPRVNILQPGPGVGGHCIAVDPWFIVAAAPERATLIRTAREVNDNKPLWVIEHVKRAIEFSTVTPSVAILGLAFKADIDDLRQSPACAITQILASQLPEIQFNVAEPNIKSLPNELTVYANIESMTVNEAVDSSNIVLILVDHKEIKAIESDSLKGKMLIDTKGALKSVNSAIN